MKYYVEESLSNFKFWSGAKENAAELTEEQFNEIESILESLYPEGMSDTEINDLFWFEFDWIKEILNREQLISLKQDYIGNVINFCGETYWGELADADSLVSDTEIFSYYDGVKFCEEDF